MCKRHKRTLLQIVCDPSDLSYFVELFKCFHFLISSSFEIWVKHGKENHLQKSAELTLLRLRLPTLAGHGAMKISLGFKNGNVYEEES